MDMTLLSQLTEAPGVSGNEAAVRRIVRARIEPVADDIRIDALGNLIALKKGHGPQKKPLIMLAAHMDEVGLMVTAIDKLGYLKVAKVGGIDNRILLAKRVLVGKDAVPGVIGVRPIHMLARKGEQNKAPAIEDLAIDIGATGQEEAQRLAAPGDYAWFDTKYEDWGRVIKAKALDDRIGCCLLIELLKGAYPFDLCAAFTTQEEIDLRGARVVAYRHKPDMAFVIDVTGAGDFPRPRERDESHSPALGAGPVITIMDRNVICDRGLVRLLEETAKAKRIPHQFKRPGIGGTDAGRIHITKEGVRTAVLSIAARYIHSPVGLASKADIANGLRLMQAALQRVPAALKK